jgi:hypothetical protein
MTQQIIRTGEWRWAMDDDHHHLTASPQIGDAKLEVNKYPGGGLSIFLTETRNRTKSISLLLHPDISKSLLEFLNQPTPIPLRQQQEGNNECNRQAD